MWRLGGYRSDFALGEGVRFAWQHDARRQPDGTLTLFDNQATPKVGAALARADAAPRRGRRCARRRRRSSSTRTASSRSPRATRRSCPTATRSSGFGSGRRVSEFDPEGELGSTSRFPADVDSYRGYRFAWRGEPSEPPRAAATRSGDLIRVAASWNGATEVTDWEVLAGPSPDALQPAGKAHRRGFETTIPVSADAAFVAVRALAGTRELGRSEPVRVP